MARRPSIAQVVAPAPRPRGGADGITLALKLYAQAVTMYANSHQLSEREARVQLRRMARVGRVPSKVMDAES